MRVFGIETKCVHCVDFQNMQSQFQNMQKAEGDFQNMQ